MPAVDFEDWAAPGLSLTLGGRTYVVPPPSVDAARMIIAAAVRGEVNLGLKTGPIPGEIERVLESIGERHPALGPVWDELVAAGVAATTIDRVVYYATFYWARGRQYADDLATLLWTPRDTEDGAGEGGDGGSPKGS